MPSWHTEAESRIFGKAIAALGLARLEYDDPREIVRTKLADDPDRDDVLGAFTKSASGGLELGSSTATPSFSSIAEGVFDVTVLGQIPGTQRLPFVHQVAGGTILGTGAAWRAEGKAIRVTKPTFSAIALARSSIGGIVVGSREFFELGIRDQSTAETISRLARDAIRRQADSTFCGSGAAVAGQQPAGLGDSAQSVSSTGATAAAIAADVRSMVATMVGGGVPLRSAVWLLSSEAFSLFAALKILDQSGSTLSGRPIVTDAPTGTVCLVAADYLSVALSDQVAIQTSSAASVEMDTAPTGNTGTPAAASSNLINLFQSDCVAVKAKLDINWSVSGPTDSNGNFAVVKLTSGGYA
jgi:hypothetical protein